MKKNAKQDFTPRAEDLTLEDMAKWMEQCAKSAKSNDPCLTAMTNNKTSKKTIHYCGSHHVGTVTTQKIASCCPTPESVWNKLISACNQIPEIQVVSDVNNEKETAINFRVTGIRGLKYIRNVFTVGRNSDKGTSVWESWLWDAGFDGGSEDVFIHSNFSAPYWVGEEPSSLKDIYLFYTLRHALTTGHDMFGLFEEYV